MDEVEPRLPIVSGDQVVRLANTHRVPAHVGDLQLRVARHVEPLHICVDPSETGQPAFLARVAHELHAEADAQHGDSSFKDSLVQHVDPAAVPETRHASIKRPHPCEDDPVRVADIGG